jgi:site-specific DNA recombinase
MLPETASSAPRPLRCAIYTRKSSEEGLEQDFNSLDAQREAAEAYILSQRQEGWVVAPHIYNDGGFTGANMDRPALGRLMADIEASRIDCVVVYKVDRLSRSLLDFARIMGAFEKHGVSFVSVTQQFNTSVPVGRLTLNILLSFAQFEREIISERTRDKKAASRKKGKWIGGYLPLGYDLEPHGGRLVVNEAEAQQVRAIFGLFRKTRSMETTLEELNCREWKTKSWITAQGVRCGGALFTEGTLTRLLTNELYTGWVVYKGKRYRGEHPAMVDGREWRRVQEIFRRRMPKRRKERNKHGALLKGVLYCGGCAELMRHTYTSTRQRRYRYYACLSPQGQCRNRVSALLIEASVLQRLEVLARNRSLASKLVKTCVGQTVASPELVAQLRTLIERVTYQRSTGRVVLRLRTQREPSHVTK